MSADRLRFCRTLSDTRLRRGLSLEAIAESSKIGVSLLLDLERGDLSRWPKGIFRRAFLREYATAIGLPPEHVVGELGRLVPEEGALLHEAESPIVSSGQEGLRLTLATSQQWWFAPSGPRTLAAALDLAAVLLIGGAVAQVAGVNLSLTTSVVGLMYYGLSTACVGSTPASLWLTVRRGRLRFGWSGRVAQPAAAEGPRLVFRRLQPRRPTVVEAPKEAPVAENLRAASN